MEFVFEGRLILKVLFASVVVATLAFLAATVAATRGVPLSSLTVPVIFLCCENEIVRERVHINNNATLLRVNFPI